MTEFFFGMVGGSLIEWIAIACGLTNVALIIRRSIWNYPFGFVMVTLYFFIFWDLLGLQALQRRPPPNVLLHHPVLRPLDLATGACG